MPGTPPGRLDWMENNPAGSTIWLFAIENKTGRLAGTISLFPKHLYIDNKRIKAAILGDFMVHRDFRVFGPALDLLKAARAYQNKGDFDLLYTIPNPQSVAVAKRVGFRSAGRLYIMMHPQRLDFLLERHIPHYMAKILNPLGMAALKLVSRETYVNSVGLIEKIDWQDEAFTEFVAKMRKCRTGLMAGEYSLSYLDWRYRRNPEYDFKVFTFRIEAGSSILGFFVFTLDKNHLELYDIVALEDKILLMMIKKVGVICREAKCRGIYSMVYERNPLLPLLKKCCFFDTKDQIELYLYAEKMEGMGCWAFTSADRNI